MARFYVLIRLKDLSHVEAEFNTKEEVEEFLETYKGKRIPHETEIIDNEKVKNDQIGRVFGYAFFIFIGLFILYFILK